MAELILTEEEQSANTWLELTDETLGKLVKATALTLKAHDQEQKRCGSGRLRKISGNEPPSVEQPVLVPLPLTEPTLRVLNRITKIITDEGFCLTSIGLLGGDNWDAKLKWRDSKGEEGYRSIRPPNVWYRSFVDAYEACQEVAGPPEWQIHYTYDKELTSELHSRGGSRVETVAYQNCTRSKAIEQFYDDHGKDAFVMFVEAIFPAMKKPRHW